MRRANKKKRGGQETGSSILSSEYDEGPVSSDDSVVFSPAHL